MKLKKNNNHLKLFMLEYGPPEYSLLCYLHIFSG